MKKKLKIFLMVLILLTVCVLAFYTITNRIRKQEPEIVTNMESIKGCYVGHLAKDVYVLRIDNENNGNVSGVLAFNNYEKDSSSGSFIGTYKDGILSGKYSFDSEGMHSDMEVIFKKIGNSFVRGIGSVVAEGGTTTFENQKNINYDSNQTLIKSADCIEKFTEENNKFTFNYNAFLQAYEPNQKQNLPNTDWRMNAKENGSLLAAVVIPRTYMPDTNFSNARLTIGASTDPKAINDCGINTGNGEVLVGEKNISGYPFKEFISRDAGAGNFYETTSYRGLLDGDCYVLEYTIHSTNIGNYSPDQNIKEFDKSKIEAEFKKIISSFKFLINSD